MAKFVLSWGAVGSAPSGLQNLDDSTVFLSAGPSMGPNAFASKTEIGGGAVTTFYKWGPDTSLLASIPPAAQTYIEDGGRAVGDKVGLYYNVSGATCVFSSTVAWGADSAFTTIPSGLSGSSLIYDAFDTVLARTTGGTVVGWGHNSSLAGPQSIPQPDFHKYVTDGSFMFAANVSGHDFTPSPGVVYGANTAANVTWSTTSAYKVVVGGSVYDPHTKTAVGTNTAVNAVPSIVTANPTMSWRVSGSAPEATDYLVVGDSILVCVNVGGTPTVVAWGGNTVINGLDQTTLNSFIGRGLRVVGNYVSDFSDFIYGVGAGSTDQPDYSSYDSYQGPYYIDGSFAAVGITNAVGPIPGRYDLFVWGDNATLNAIPPPLDVTQDYVEILCTPSNSLVVAYSHAGTPAADFWTDFKNTFATDGSPVLVKPSQTITTPEIRAVDFQTESYTCPPAPPAGGGFIPPSGAPSGCYILYKFQNSATGQTASALVAPGADIPPAYTGSQWFVTTYSTVCY